MATIQPEIRQSQSVMDHANDLLPPAWIPRADASREARSAGGAEAGLWETDARGQARSAAVGVIRGAREMVCLSSFLLADREIVTALLDRARAGARVYVLTASENRLKSEPREDSEFELRVFEEHKTLLDELAGRALLRSGEALHAKYVLADPKGRKPAGMLFTANLTSEALTRNPELAVTLDEEEVSDLFEFFRWGFWKQGDYELFEPYRLVTCKPSPDFTVRNPTKLPITSSGASSLKEEVSRLVSEGEGDLWLTSFGFDKDHPTTKWILAAVRSGRNVRIIARVRPKASHMGALIALREAGAEVRGHPFIHAKSVLARINGRLEGVVMSANLEPHGMDNGYEAGVVLKGDRAQALELILSRWWGEAPSSLVTGEKLGNVSGEVQLYLEDSRGGAPLGRFERTAILPEYRKDLGPVSGEPKFPPPEQKGVRTLYHRQVYTWRPSVTSGKPSPKA